MYTQSSDEEMKLLKKLWHKEEVNCPKCEKAILVHLHKKAKKSNCDWKCPVCGEVYRTISILKELQDLYRIKGTNK